MTVLILGANLIGIAVAVLLVTVAVPVPDVFEDAPYWVSFVAAPAYILAALAVGTFSITRGTVEALRWAIEEREPSPATSAIRSWRRGG